ncbi:MAG: tetratricopeptide repeat protein [Verrucomicrobiota bacterium]|nr:tetratricopeptide repeat protein [Verrucomicrobiota bacterium]
MPASLSPNEEAQLAQTIEMFEVITQSQPLDYQSLEILKEAYSKLGREKDVVGTSKRIAQAYVQLGQLSSAILEYESILQRFPDDPDVQRALAAIENKANSFANGGETDFLSKPQPPAPGTRKQPDGKPAVAAADIDDGRQMMQKIFIEGKLLSQTDFDMYWPTPKLNEAPRQAVEPFLHVLAEKQILPVDRSLKVVVEKSRFAYVPLEKYDVDIELARTFSKDVCNRWCILPFDKMSKSILVATANPFNKQAARDLEALTKNRLLWYVASPAELLKIVKKAFR